MWRPRRPANAPLEAAVGVKDAEGVEVWKMWRPRRPAKAPLEAAVGVKDAQGVEVGKMRRPRKLPAKAPLEATVGPKDARGVAVVKMWRPRRPAKAEAPLELEAPAAKGAQGEAVGKMWRPRRPAKAPLEGVGVKDAQSVAVVAVDGEAEASMLGAPVVAAVGGGEKGPLDDGIAVCRMEALYGEAPVIATDGKVEALVLGVPVVAAAGGGEKGPLEDLIAVYRMDSFDDGALLIPTDGKGEASVLGVPVVAAARGGEKGPLEDGIAMCRMDALDDGAPVIPVVAAAGGGEMGPLEDEIAVCRMDALDDGAPVITNDGKAEASVLGFSVVASGGGEKRPLEDGIAVCRMGVIDVGALVITTDGKFKESVVGVSVVAAAGGGGKVPLEDGIMVCQMDTLDDGAPVIATDERVEASVLGVSVVVATGCGEKGPQEDGIAVCRMDTLDNGAPLIATDEKGEALLQGDSVAEAVQAIAVKGNGKEEKDVEGIKWLKHYSSAQSILFVGDGDFSFSLALATAFGSGENLVATSLDSYGALTSKYGKAESNVRELRRLGATVLHGVDAKTMKLHSCLEMRRFDRIVFNFPHAGFKGKEDQLHVINAHRQLVHGFLANARHLLRPYGETHLSHKTGFPYDAWDIEQLAYESCLIMVRKVGFFKEDYPGYEQKRGDSATCDQPFALGQCCTFMFCMGDEEKLKQAHVNRVGSISSFLCDNKFYPGISATDMRPFDMRPFELHPLSPAWPQLHFPPVNIVHMPIAFDPCPFGVAEMEHPVNCYCTSFHHQDMVQPVCTGPPLNVFPSQGGFQQSWYQEGTLVKPSWTPQEHQSLQREYEIHRQLTLSLEHRYMESLERWARLEMLFQVYGR